MKLALGDRVSTPQGDGTVVGWAQVDMRLGWPPLYRPYVTVELERGVRRFPAGQISELSSTKAENEADEPRWGEDEALGANALEREERKG